MKHVTEDEFLLLADGGIPANRAEALHAHLAECSACNKEWSSIQELVSDLRAPTGLATDAHVASVMSRLDDAVGQDHGPRTRRPWMFGAVGATLAVAAAIVLIPRLSPPEFAARGGKGEASLARDVGVTVYALDGSAPATRANAALAVRPQSKFLAGTRNLHDTPAYLATFAIDTKGTVHWLYPAYEHPSQDPVSISLERSADERPLSTQVELDAPSAGAMRIVSLVTSEPLHIKAIDALPSTDLTNAELSKRFPNAVLYQQEVTILP